VPKRASQRMGVDSIIGLPVFAYKELSRHRIDGCVLLSQVNVEVGGLEWILKDCIESTVKVLWTNFSLVSGLEARGYTDKARTVRRP
jgi:hypothetical protein